MTHVLPPGERISVSSYEDREMIKDLYSQYAYAADDEYPEAFAECFTPDGWMTGSNVPNGRVEGREALAAMTRRANEWNADNGITAHRHINTNFRISVTGDRALGSCNLLYYWVREGKLELVTTGGYDDHLVKIDGQWYFESRAGYSDTNARTRSWD